MFDRAARMRRTPRLGIAALLCLGSVALAPAPLAQADPPGNNGTVKIVQLGEFDDVPENNPHVGCTFEVEWYGFDEGADITSTVGFEEQAPTTGVGMTVDGPREVFVGGDDASGAGTPTGFDGSATYTLAFTGQPHPQQGYHVELTIATPGSIGNDTKSKVFWVEGGAPVTPPTTPTPETPTTPTTPSTPEVPEVLPETEQAPDVLGVQAFGNVHGNGGAQAQQQGQQQLPTAVNAGAAGAGTAPGTGISIMESLLGLLLVLLGAVTARLGWLRARG